MSTTKIFKNNVRKKSQRKASEPTPKNKELQNGSRGMRNFLLTYVVQKSAKAVGGERGGD